MRVLIVNQCFYPDVAATGQYAADLACELVRRGHEVVVLASQRAYDDPRLRFAKTDLWRAIRIRRIPCTGYGKGARWRRAADFATFYAGCVRQLLSMPRFDAVVAMTTPPLISFLAALFVRLRGGALHVWLMDRTRTRLWRRGGCETGRRLCGC